MDLGDQLKKLFPDHVPSEQEETDKSPDLPFWVPATIVDCVYEKRRGKPVTVIRNYQGTKADLNALASVLKKELHVGGGATEDEIVIQGDFRDRIMLRMREFGFTVRRVGG